VSRNFGKPPGFRQYSRQFLELTKLPNQRKFQAPKSKSQTNPNDQNSKYQTIDPQTAVPNWIMIDGIGLMNRYDSALVVFWSLNIEIYL